jgi:hypothetical protein
MIYIFKNPIAVKKTPTLSITMSTITSSGNNIVSPRVTTYSPDGFINVDSELKETVIVDGIDSQFNITLSDISAVKILNAFTVSGFSVDCRLGKKDPEMTGLAVTMDSVDFKTVIADAITNAKNAATPNETIDQYLANQLRNAFVSAFGSYLPTGSLDGNGVANDSNNGGETGQTEQSGTSSADPAQDARAGTGSVAVTVATTIQGFKVDVLTDAVAAANNLVTQHALLSSSAPLNIFRQIPKTSWTQYLNDASGWATTYLDTNALPMLKEDVLTFVFDMDVTTAGSDAGNAAVEDVPVVNDQSTAYGEQKFSLNLANRRVALNLTLSSGSGAFPVGGANGLRVHPTAWVQGANAGAGTNAADGANNGATQ